MESCIRQYPCERLFLKVNRYPLIHCREVGDYGLLERDTGQFIYHGNIYKEGILSPLEEDYAPRGSNGSKGVISITSLNAKAINVGPAFNVNAQVARLKFQVRAPVTVSLSSNVMSFFSVNGAFPKEPAPC